MRTYYLFIIKKDVFNLYYNNSDILYKTLENLFYLKRETRKYGLSIYNQICDTFNTDIINNYFHIRNDFFVRRKGKKVLINNRLDNEKYIVEVRNSCLIILCNRNLPKVLKILNYYNPRIFVCDFKLQDYFWNNNNHNSSKNKYNLV